MDRKSAFVGIDVAFAKPKRLPVCVCTWQDGRLEPAALRGLPLTSRHTGWPHGNAPEPAFREIAFGPAHDRLDAYLSAWVAALEEHDRMGLGDPPDDVIWVPELRGAQFEPGRPGVEAREAKRPSRTAAPPPASRPPVEAEASGEHRRWCPACGEHEFKRWPFGWDAHAGLRPLLEEFGPPRKSYHTEYPFWYLRNDGLWEVRGVEAAKVRKGKASQPTKSELLRPGAAGGLVPEAFEVLRSDPRLLREIAGHLVDAHFPDTLRADVLAAVGLDDLEVVRRRKRDPRFRSAVLVAYGYRCAVCDFDARLVNGGPPTEEALLRFDGKGIRFPRDRDARPGDTFIGWHRTEVFRSHEGIEARHS